MAKQYVTIGNFAIDCIITEEPSHQSELSQFPVEEGSDIADNIRIKPLTLKLEGVVSNTPIGPMADLRASAGQTNPAASLRDAFQEIEDAKEPITIIGKLKTYTNMVQIDWSCPANAEAGDSQPFTATYNQVEIVTNTFRNIRVAVPRATGKNDLGNRPPVPTNLTTGAPGGRKIVDQGRGHFTYEDGTPVPKDALDKASRDAGAVPVKYVNGKAVPASPVEDATEIDPWYGDSRTTNLQKAGFHP